MRVVLFIWNWSVFSNLDRQVEELNRKILSLEHQLQINWVETLEAEMIDNKRELAIIPPRQNHLLASKANLRWVAERDQNSDLFHATLKVCWNHNYVQLELPNGDFTDDPNIIGNKAAEHFDALLGSFPQS
ncbi:hypothetical protein QQ045_030331 [Rhodiola kirilowii]